MADFLVYSNADVVTGYNLVLRWGECPTADVAGQAEAGETAAVKTFVPLESADPAFVYVIRYRPGDGDLTQTLTAFADVPAPLADPLYGLVPVTDEEDTTAGRLLLTGYRGLGKFLKMLPTAGGLFLQDRLMTTGWNVYDSSIIGGGPISAATRHTLMTMAYNESPNERTFLDIQHGGTDNSLRAWIGANIGLSPAFWKEIALMERGSNANGRFEIFSNGMQICYHTLSAMSATTTASGSWFIGPEATWTFPASFSAAPFTAGSVRTSNPTFCNARPTGGTSALVRLASSISIAGAMTTDVFAVGLA